MTADRGQFDSLRGYSSARGRRYAGELLERSSPHPSRTFKTGIVNNLERYSVIYLLSFSQGIQRCCHPKKQKRLRGDPSPRSTAEKGASCGGQVTVTLERLTAAVSVGVASIQPVCLDISVSPMLHIDYSPELCLIYQTPSRWDGKNLDSLLFTPRRPPTVKMHTNVCRMRSHFYTQSSKNLFTIS